MCSSPKHVREVMRERVCVTTTVTFTVHAQEMTQRTFIVLTAHMIFADAAML